jgi:hypothetical protein
MCIARCSPSTAPPTSAWAPLQEQHVLHRLESEKSLNLELDWTRPETDLMGFTINLNNAFGDEVIIARRFTSTS